jgi:hypothetical protein
MRIDCAHVSAVSVSFSVSVCVSVSLSLSLSLSPSLSLSLSLSLCCVPVPVPCLCLSQCVFVWRCFLLTLHFCAGCCVCIFIPHLFLKMHTHLCHECILYISGRDGVAFMAPATAVRVKERECVKRAPSGHISHSVLSALEKDMLLSVCESTPGYMYV